MIHQVDEAALALVNALLECPIAIELRAELLSHREYIESGCLGVYSMEFEGRSEVILKSLYDAGVSADPLLTPQPGI